MNEKIVSIINSLEIQNQIIERATESLEKLKSQLIEELKNQEEKNYRTEHAIYSLVTKTNDKFDEKKFKEEHKDIYDKYLKTKISFDITNFKKCEKEYTKQYTQRGEITYGLMIKENKNDKESEEK